MAKLSKKIIIVGRTASGKTTLKEMLCKEWNLRPEISFTSRPIREGEVDGIDYNFISKADFQKQIADGKMLQYDYFNGNYYGTTLEEFNESDVMIATPQGVDNASRVRSVMFVIYLYAPQSVILDRLSSRHKIKVKGDMQVIHERMNADNMQFLDFEKARPYDIEVDSSKPMELMLAQIKKYENQFK